MTIQTASASFSSGAVYDALSNVLDYDRLGFALEMWERFFAAQSQPSLRQFAEMIGGHYGDLVLTEKIYAKMLNLPFQQKPGGHVAAAPPAHVLSINEYRQEVSQIPILEKKLPPKLEPPKSAVMFAGMVDVLLKHVARTHERSEIGSNERGVLIEAIADAGLPRHAENVWSRWLVRGEVDVMLSTDLATMRRILRKLYIRVAEEIGAPATDKALTAAIKRAEANGDAANFSPSEIL